MTTEIMIVAVLAGLAIGWLLGGRTAGKVREQLAAAQVHAGQVEQVRQMHQAVETERDRHLRDLTDLRARSSEREAALEARALEREATWQASQDRLLADKEALGAQFAETGAKLLENAQKQFLERADARFKQSEATTGQGLAALLAPVTEKLARYEAGVAKVEAERRDAFGDLKGQIEAMRVGTERVSGEAAKLVNALRNAPKARGRWGEQQLRNVLESCGLSEHADFQTEVSITGEEGGRLRPDVIINVPGGQSLVIDAKVSLNAYQDAFGAVDEGERQLALTAHTASMRAHVNSLGNKAYWSQFADAPDYVIMFVPGEHFLSAALEHDPTLWDFAFEKRVLLATPTNLIAIARTVAAVWRQEKLAGQAREIAELGKDLYARLSVMGGHVARVGKNLDTAVGAYNSFVGSLESQVLTQARKFEALNIETSGKAIESPHMIEQSTRPLVKLAAIGDEET
ncbi:DNA recombination protein RmuC [Sphingomonas sp.]|uniref:DNA recombination protein RmuC n=1 Tax=Sphingomonas sp. TaxID=28214 RepID=UPI0025F81176|nr:DNA recombination protein RmuC [Sphingomonas sp.]